MKNINFVFFTIILILSGCKTAEQIKREQLVDNLAIQMTERQKLTSDSTIRIQNIEEQISLLRGQVEQSSHSQQVNTQSEIDKIKEDISLLKEKIQTIQIAQDNHKADLADQKALLGSILKSLTKISKAPESPYDLAMKDYRKGKYKKAEVQLLELINVKSIRGNKKARIYHNLGMISYMNKKYNDAITYFSKLISTYKKAPYNANGLLFLAKSFQSLGQIEEAKQTLSIVLNDKRYKKSKTIPKAKKLLKTLNK